VLVGGPLPLPDDDPEEFELDEPEEEELGPLEELLYVLLDDETSDEELEPEEPDEPDDPDESGGWQQPSPSASTSHLPLSP
jgi:hypothetical protein